MRRQPAPAAALLLPAAALLLAVAATAVHGFLLPAASSSPRLLQQQPQQLQQRGAVATAPSRWGQQHQQQHQQQSRRLAGRVWSSVDANDPAAAAAAAAAAATASAAATVAAAEADPGLLCGHGYYGAPEGRRRELGAEEGGLVLVEGPAPGSEEGEGRRVVRLLLADGATEASTASFIERRGGGLCFTGVAVAEGQRGKGYGRRVAMAALERFLNKGGRIAQVTAAVPAGAEGAVAFFEKTLGLVKAEGGGGAEEGQVLLQGDLNVALERVGAYVATPEGAKSALALNLLGRLKHDARDFAAAGDLYTKALAAAPNDSAVFQNLGGAFASQGEHQLAFASFQRAIDLDPRDRFTYFKLGMMYEQLATGKFKEAAEHALKCYEFYCDGAEGGADTDALTIYGNLLLKRLYPEEAAQAYQRALALQPGLYNVWFNLANALLKLGKREEAIAALQRTLALNPDVSAARHLLLSLTEEGRGAAMSADPKYVVELFDFYAPLYDQHMKEGLLYTAPRILRQEVRQVYNRTLLAAGAGNVTEALQQALNKTLRILDLGCGTGLCGAWFTDYSARMVGVDISPKMVEQAKKKLVYDELHVGDLREWVAAQAQAATAASSAADAEPYDLIISADVLQYLGQLEGVFQDAAALLEPKRGLMAFTLEELQADYGQAAADGGRAARGFLLGPTGRFLHTKAYVERALAQAGLVVETSRSYSPRMERGEPVPGFLYVVRRKRDGQI